VHLLRTLQKDSSAIHIFLITKKESIGQGFLSAIPISIYLFMPGFLAELLTISAQPCLGNAGLDVKISIEIIFSFNIIAFRHGINLLKCFKSHVLLKAIISTFKIHFFHLNEFSTRPNEYYKPLE
jgi:hypothetical protein